MSTEWGIKHSQGIATYRSEQDAQNNLHRHVASWQRSQSKRNEKMRPVIVSREVTDWKPIEEREDLTSK